MMSQPVGESVMEYKLRVPRNLVKNYYVMKINAPRPVKFDEINEAHLSRVKKSKEDEEEDAGPKYGAGSEYGRDRKEEAKKRRRVLTLPKETKKEDLPMTMRLGGKKGKWYSGRKEGTILENSSYYILTQSPDGVFEAVPIQAWYNFSPNIHYHTLTSDEVEEEFSKRDKTINLMNLMVKKRLDAAEEENEEKSEDSKVKSKAGDRLANRLKKTQKRKRGKIFIRVRRRRKREGMTMTMSRIVMKKKNLTVLNQKKLTICQKHLQELEDVIPVESSQVQHTDLDSAKDDEELQLQDEPEPEKLSKKVKAKDDLNAYTLSESEEEREADEELTNVGKELKEILKRETGEDESSAEEDEEDEDIDESEKYTKSALFMPGKESKKKKGKSGSNSGSASSSRSCTPTPGLDSVQSVSPSTGKKLSKEDKGSSAKKRPSSRIGQPDTSTPPSKKQKQSPQPPPSASSGNGNGTNEVTLISEEAIRRYLSHKPMTTTDLVKKFKHKKTGLTKEELVSTIAAILKRIGPERETIDGKLYLSIKPSKK